jgi:hypothetical protein
VSKSLAETYIFGGGQRCVKSTKVDGRWLAVCPLTRECELWL